MTIIDEIKKSFKKGSILTRLIYINLAIFLLVNIVEIFFFLFNQHDSYSRFLLAFALPADLGMLARKPWTLLTYMFLHKSFFHILFNLLWLYWFGRIFVQYLDEKKLAGVYILGGLSGAVMYILVFNAFPVFQDQLPLSYALGASASVMAIVIAISVYSPNYTIYLLFFGRVKIIYVALIGFLASSIIEFSMNTGGKLAHIGGALFGYLFIMRLRQGKDMTKFISRLLDTIAGWFKPKPRIKVSHRNAETDLDYNRRRKDEQAEVDRILDKIAKAGYDSLTKDEKETLFKQSQK
ncbi:MAG: rhomboid family intramembrane serine protease [Bacteroidales bacterium]|nr:rhomboid family intramembrane serine protease [Bacteroidales bacterium]